MPKKDEESYSDVIIVGAGISGCVLGFHLANAQINVKIIEKKPREEIFDDWCDSIEKKAFGFSGIPLPKGKEKRPDRDHLAIISPDMNTIIHLDYYDYFIVDRKLFHERVLNSAEKAGCKFYFETEAIEPIGKGMWVVGVKTKNNKIYNARLTVDCSGEARILGMNIEILDMNWKKTDIDFVQAYRELHKISEKTLFWSEHEIKKDTLYYRYGHLGGYTWLNFEKEDEIDIGAGIAKSVSNRSPKGIVNDFVNSNSEIESTKLRGGGGKIIVRRPITLVWYGFMLVGQAACQTIPTNGCGIGSAMIAAKIAAETIIPSIKRKDVSIDNLWEYQVNFTKERGRDLAAIDIMRIGLQKISEENISFLMRKKIITKNDLQNMIHAKYRKTNFLKMIISLFRGIKRLKLLLYLQKVITAGNKIYKHYKKIPKEYSSKQSSLKYKQWLLESMKIFKEIEEIEPKFVGNT